MRQIFKKMLHVGQCADYGSVQVRTRTIFLRNAHVVQVSRLLYPGRYKLLCPGTYQAPATKDTINQASCPVVLKQQQMSTHPANRQKQTLVKLLPALGWFLIRQLCTHHKSAEPTAVMCIKVLINTRPLFLVIERGLN